MDLTGTLGLYLLQEICEYDSGKCMSIILCILLCSMNVIELSFAYFHACQTLIITLPCEC